MRDNLHEYRQSYHKGYLSEDELDKNPLQQFRTWFYEAKEAGGVDEVNAMTLSAIGLDGYPKGRVVLLKKYNEEGFFFYTNYNSDKGESISQNNKVVLSFFWPNTERQVIVKGIASKTSEVDSDNYFASRPKGSQLSVLVSTQSKVIGSREELDNKLKSLEKEYKDKEVVRPKHWGGFLVSPVEIEFWQGRPNRLHDRIRYTLKGLDWKIERLAP